jgi:hypothetical protein
MSTYSTQRLLTLCFLGFLILIAIPMDSFAQDEKQENTNLQWDLSISDQVFFDISNCLSDQDSDNYPWNKIWNLCSQWAVAYLNEHPCSSPDEFQRAIQALLHDLPLFGQKDEFDWPDDLEMCAFLPLAHQGEKAYAVSFYYDMSCCFFIVGESESNQYKILWDMDEMREKQDPSIDTVGQWLKVTSKDRFWAGQGQISLQELPAGADGKIRFYWHIMDVHVGGSWYGYQTRICEWDGKAFDSLYVKTYSTNWDGLDLDFHFENNIHWFTMADDFRALLFYSYGGPASTCKVKIEPQKIEDMGCVSECPELYMIDDFPYHFFHHTDLNSIATEKAINQFQAIKLAYDISQNGEPYIFYNGWEKTKMKNRANIIIHFGAWDEVTNVQFSFKERNGKSVIDSILLLPDNEEKE